jgi:hypothetical protein
METKHVILLLIITVIVIFYIQVKDLKEHNYQNTKIPNYQIN